MPARTAPSLLPEEPYGLFLAVRRGLPLVLSAAFLGLALGHPALRGWWLIAAVAAFATVLPTFAGGEAYLHGRPSIVRWDGYWAKAFRPLARLLGREEEWVLSFCAWNNHRVRGAFEARKSRRALILLPHCIQMARCKADIFTDLENCYECGKCPVGDYLQGVLEHRWDGRVTNRSHKAYRAAREFRPDLIVAVSCTDRLLKGLTKLTEVPAYVIPLSLPHGMCVDTDFQVSHLMGAMHALVEPKRGPEPIELEKGGVA